MGDVAFGGGGVPGIATICDKGEGGVKNFEKLGYVVCGRSLRKSCRLRHLRKMAKNRSAWTEYVIQPEMGVANMAKILKKCRLLG